MLSKEAFLYWWSRITKGFPGIKIPEKQEKEKSFIERCNIAPFIYVCETKDLYILTFSETGVFFAICICQYINAIKRQARDKLDDPAATPSKGTVLKLV